MIENIINRVSHKSLTDPKPTKEEMEKIYQAALRAPDHALMKPTSFIEISGKGLDKLSSIFKKYILENGTKDEKNKIEKYANAPFRAPMIIILVSEVKFHPKVPELEQFLSTAAAAQNILLAIDSLGYSGIWRTGIMALDEKLNTYFKLKSNQKILGYIYIGTATGKKKNRLKLKTDEFVTRWS